jgi:hypothetical protein
VDLILLRVTRPLIGNLTGFGNTANGANALGGGECDGCSNNTAVGANALNSVFGPLQNNTAVGADTLPLSFAGG